jgi:16S rRNA C1402 (ribose-2'-O) methylase RsmI
MILYVSPHKLVNTSGVHYLFGEDRQICVSRELSNYTKNRRGTAKGSSTFEKTA